MTCIARLDRPGFVNVRVTERGVKESTITFYDDSSSRAVTISQVPNDEIFNEDAGELERRIEYADPNLIVRYRHRGWSYREIGRVMHRSPSTIRRIYLECQRLAERDRRMKPRPHTPEAFYRFERWGRMRHTI